MRELKIVFILFFYEDTFMCPCFIFPCMESEAKKISLCPSYTVIFYELFDFQQLASTCPDCKCRQNSGKLCSVFQLLDAFIWLMTADVTFVHVLAVGGMNERIKTVTN